MSGILYGVSTGPGDPELMTLKAVRRLEKCGTVFIPRTKGENTLALSIAEQCVDMSGKKLIYADFPMSSDTQLINENYRRIADKICSELEKGDCAMLCLGDISVYSTFSPIADIVTDRGFAVERIAGVTSFCAAAAALGISLASGSEVLTVIPYSSEELPGLAGRSGKKVIMKSGRNSAELLCLLAENGQRVWAAENVGLPDEKLICDVSSEETGYFTVFISENDNA
ncbi:MAG: Cobalt-precorrin-2 C(20)-methyltransferase [Firmicutes bacterium ADurb.BinA205]|nr:MAG: Cobalt-precorrin-2 C(20)-methyltransferase [Firmicutes bacterium ADurb.BinA205]